MMNGTLIKFQKAISRFDELNSADPNMEMENGEKIPKEVLYAKRMTQTLLKFEPGASETLLLAARCQHLCRWEIPRSDFPTGRKGYNMWRTTLKKYHSEKAGKVLYDLEFTKAQIERVQFLVLKKQLKRDRETQILEDVICLVFLSHYFEKFAAKHPEEKVVDILRKTWNKMSENGQLSALILPLSEKVKDLIKKAVGV